MPKRGRQSPRGRDDGGSRYSVAAGAVQGLLAYARSRGVATAAVLESAGLDPAALADPAARVPQPAYNRLVEDLTVRSGDADFGLHFAERLDLDAFHVVGHVAAKSATFGEALSRVAAASRLVHDAGRVEIEHSGDEVRVFPGCRGLLHEFPRQVAEYAAGSVIVLGRRLTGARWSPRAVDFRHRAPPRVAEHVRILGVAPRFGRVETMLVLERSVLDLPVRGADPAVARWLDAYARQALEKLSSPPQDLSARVRHAAVLALQRGARPEIGPVAAQLAVTPRTLQRRLAAEGTSFAAVGDEARRDLAERWLADPQLSVGEVAFLAGFSDPSSFHRAFRRWNGKSPASWRRNVTAVPDGPMFAPLPGK